MTVLPFRSLADLDSALPIVADHLDSGGVLAYPTETVYGLGTRVAETDLEILRSVTLRPVWKPFLILVTGGQMARRCGLVLNEAAERLAECFWPGPVTLILPASGSSLPDALRGPGGGVAVRWSSHELTGRLVEGLGVPISSTSANMSGQTPLATVEQIAGEFEIRAGAGRLLLLDGGTLSNVVSSTLVDCTSSEPRVMREGPISSDQIWECVKRGRK